jgi:hypothetical protein
VPYFAEILDLESFLEFFFNASCPTSFNDPVQFLVIVVTGEMKTTNVFIAIYQCVCLVDEEVVDKLLLQNICGEIMKVIDFEGDNFVIPTKHITLAKNGIR